MQLSIILKGSKKLLPHPSTIRNLQLEQPRASPSNVLIHCQAQAKLHLDLQAGVQPALQGRYTSPGWHNPPARTCCTATNSLENIQLGPDEPSSSREEGRKRQWQGWGWQHKQCFRSNPSEFNLPSFLLSSMSANKPILMICQSSPSTRWGFPSLKSSAPILTTWQPMADAEFKARFRFSCKQQSPVRHSPGRCCFPFHPAPAEWRFPPCPCSNSSSSEETLWGNTAGHSPAEILRELWWQQAESIRTELGTRV